MSMARKVANTALITDRAMRVFSATLGPVSGAVALPHGHRGPTLRLNPHTTMSMISAMRAPAKVDPVTIIRFTKIM